MACMPHIQHLYIAIMLVPSIDKSEITLPCLLDKKEIQVESFDNSDSESNIIALHSYMYMLVMLYSMFAFIAHLADHSIPATDLDSRIDDGM